MFKKLLEKRVGQTISDSDFKEVLNMATDDIKFNRIGFRKHTNLREALVIAEYCYIALN